ncbi:MAG: lipopolysaccharide heptosyltransferase II, partial [Betaproteobacteria bacterium]|nr:lipopolysaccharide heptosyltransferase II [Betaproteobacteria bacterium]
PGTPLPRPLTDPSLVSTPEQQAATLAALDLPRPARLAAFCPGAEYGPAKRWPAKHFATLARRLADQGWTVWLFGSPKDAPVGDEIVAQSGGAAQNLCGITSLDQAIDLLALADQVVCNDSGLMHVAAALGRPLAALYGSSSPGFTPPLSSRAKVLRLGLECSPCFKRECPLSGDDHLRCLRDLQPEAVLAALDEETKAP